MLLLAGGLTGCHHVPPPPDEDFPARKAPRYEALVSAHWVKRVLDFHESGGRTPRPPTYRHDRFVILDVSWGDLAEARDYRVAHIPGAIHFNTDDLETGYPVWRLREAAALHETIGRAGITPDTTVIVCGRKLIAAARVWWALKYAGVDDVRLLDGGMAAWRAAGYPVEQTVRTPQPAAFAAPALESMLATTDYVREQVEASQAWLADVRSAAEFSGRTSGYSYLEARGRLPGAIAIGDGDDDARLYLRGDGRLRPPAEILELWRQQGLAVSASGKRFEREVIFYCGGGWRSSVAFFYAWLLGLENVRNYSDGWSGWSTAYQRDPEARGSTPGWRQVTTGNPVVTGR